MMLYLISLFPTIAHCYKRNELGNKKKKPIKHLLTLYFNIKVDCRFNLMNSVLSWISYKFCYNIGRYYLRLYQYS